MVKKKRIDFQVAHAQSHGLKITARDAHGVVVSVECQFCAFHGRAARANGKRSRTSSVKVFTTFRKEQYDRHHASQHPAKWIEYQALAADAKAAFFKPKQITMDRFVPPPSPGHHFLVTEGIVETIVGDMFFHSEEELTDGRSASKATALKLFKRTTSSPHYSISIANASRFDVVIDSIAVGLSFRQTARIMDVYKQHTGHPKLGGINGTTVSDYVRVLVGINLQKIADLLTRDDVWAFSLACDGSTHRGVSLFDVRVRLCVDGVLHNLHVVVVPFFERHTANNIVATTVKLFNVLCPYWRDKLLAVTTDGENTMTGRITGVATQISAMATNTVVRVWCAAHQADLVVKAVTQRTLGGSFSKTAHAWSVHLRLQQNLIMEMGSKCPKDTTRWIQFGEMVRWFLAHRLRLLAHAVSAKPVDAPAPKWWLLAASVRPLLAAVNVTITILQGKLLVLSQQREELDRLVLNLTIMLNLRLVDLDRAFELLDASSYRRHGRWWVRLTCIKSHVMDQGSWTWPLLQSLPAVEHDEILVETATYALELVEGLSCVQAERDEFNLPGEDASQVLPADVASLRPYTFVTEILRPRQTHLEQCWTPAEIEQIEDEQRDLRSAYVSNRNATKTKIDRHTNQTNFNQAWDDINDFHLLRRFLGGLATTFANTASVESDFSTVKWEKDDNRTSMTSLTLEGIMQAKQRSMLVSTK